MSSSREEDVKGGGAPLAKNWTVINIRHTSGSIAAQEGVEHGQLHALLVPPTPRHHCTLAVGCVEVMAITRISQADTDGRGYYQRHSSQHQNQTECLVLVVALLPDDGFA